MILTALLGIFGSLLPELLKFFREKDERKHELDMLQLQSQIAEKQHEWRLQEIETQADIKEQAEIMKPQKSFGVEILDKAVDTKMANWMILPVFWAFSFADWITTMIRPTITLLLVAHYMFLKFAQALISKAQAVKHPEGVMDHISNISAKVGDTWTQFDSELLTLVISFWFGGRLAQKVFGKK